MMEGHIGRDVIMELKRVSSTERGLVIAGRSQTTTVTDIYA